MRPIEQSLRKVISKSQALDTDGRNQVYLAARKEILKLDPSSAEPAMQALFDAIKNIEAEYVASPADPPVQQQGTAPASEPPEPLQQNAPPKLNVTDTLSGLPWRMILWISALVLAMAVSTFLLFAELKKANIIGGIELNKSPILNPEKTSFAAGLKGQDFKKYSVERSSTSR